MNGGSRPQACPFVAFDDDRDRRSEAPDPRHRCFAVPNPEPRAIAHQQAYCLTPNFPSCAFFMDWAGRAAAAPLAGSGAGFGAAPVTGSGYDAYGPPGGQAADIESPEAADPGGRTWAAPPAWVGDPDVRASEPPPQAWAPPPLPATPSPALPEQLMALPEPEEPEDDRDYDLSGDAPIPGLDTPAPEGAPPYAPAPYAPAPYDVAAAAANPDPGVLPVPSEAYPEEDLQAPDRAAMLAPLPPVAPDPTGVPPSPAPSPYAPPVLGAPTPSGRPPAGPPFGAPLAAGLPSAYGWTPEEPPPVPRYAPAGPEVWSNPGSVIGSMPDDMDPGPVPPEPRSRLAGRPIDASGAPRFTTQARQPVKKKEGEWSQPRRFEAYPTLGGRMRLGRFSPVLVGAFAIAIVALLLFLLPGMLGGGGTPRASHTPAAATATVLPTPTPVPTPQTYTVKANDTLSGISKSLGRTVDQMACFNGIATKDINKISIGQVLKIPPADYSCPVKPTPTKK